MPGKGHMGSRKRLAVLKTLAASKRPLTVTELAKLTGFPYNTVRGNLVRPRQARWVAVNAVVGRGPVTLTYQLTDTGRAQLAAHTEQDPIEGEE
jgi:DNA-binding IclR family transcriptional regulator